MEIHSLHKDQIHLFNEVLSISISKHRGRAIASV